MHATQLTIFVSCHSFLTAGSQLLAWPGCNQGHGVFLHVQAHQLGQALSTHQVRRQVDEHADFLIPVDLLCPDVGLEARIEGATEYPVLEGIENHLTSTIGKLLELDDLVHVGQRYSLLKVWA